MGTLTVLIVDDEESDRYLLRRLLRRAKIGDEVLEAADGEDALELLPARLAARAEGERLLVFVDINMPRVGGFEFIERFEGMGAPEDAVALFVLSSSLRPDERARALAHPSVRDYIAKMPPDAYAMRLALQPVETWLPPLGARR